MTKLENVDLTKFFHTKTIFISNASLIISLLEIIIGMFLVYSEKDWDFGVIVGYVVLTFMVAC